MVLSEQVPPHVHVPLHEENEDELVETSHFLLGQKSLLTGRNLHKICPLLRYPLHQRVPKSVPRDVCPVVRGSLRVARALLIMGKLLLMVNNCDGIGHQS